MTNDTEIIELKFEGNGINPSKVKASEVAELISNYERAIVSLVKHTHDEVSDDFVLISFEQIENKSLSLKCVAHKAKDLVVPAYLIITGCFNNNNFNSLPHDSIKGLRGLTSFAKKYNCDGVFLKDDERLAAFNPDSKISYSNEGIIKGETTIFGEVKRAGGEEPRVTLKINNEYSLSFDVKKEIAQQLAGNLYKEVALTGIAKWDKTSYKVLDFRATEVSKIRDEKLSTTFKDLGRLFGNYLDNIDNEGLLPT